MLRAHVIVALALPGAVQQPLRPVIKPLSVFRLALGHQKRGAGQKKQHGKQEALQGHRTGKA
jgi:hypothetical protein